MTKEQKLPGGGKINFPHQSYEGPPDQYDFGSQWSVYGKLKELLAAQDVSFVHMGATNIKKNLSDYARNFAPDTIPEERPSFVVVAGSVDEPVLVWERFIGTKNRGSHNVIYVAGKIIAVGEFIKLCDLRRAMLFV